MSKGTGCVILVAVIGMMTAMLGFVALQSGMTISEVVDIGTHDLSGASALRGIDDRKRVDVTAVQASAVEHVKKRWPDATLVSVRADNVSPEGFSDLTLGSGAILAMAIGSPSLVKSLPKGVAGSDKPECVSVYVDARSARFNTMNLPGCAKAFESGELPALPRCSLKQVWTRALAKGAPTGAVGTVSYTPGYGAWHVAVGSSTTSLPDDC